MWISLDNPVALWWLGLSTVAAVNILIWLWTWRANRASPVIYFAGAYVFVCAFRSFLPRADVQRIVLFDTWLSSVFIGRTAATIGELAFVIEWAIVLNCLARETGTKIARIASLMIVPMIAVAECCSWYGVITTHYVGNAIEESIWSIAYIVVIIALLSLVPKLKGALKVAASVAVVGCLFYTVFMFTVDVPMYLHRLAADNAIHKPLYGFIDGIIDLNTRWRVSHDIQEWRTEIPWQTLYFSFAVWAAIALCYVPLKFESFNKHVSR